MGDTTDDTAPTSASPHPTSAQRVQIAARSGRAVRTVDRIYAGGDSLASVRADVIDAARALGYAAPPAPRSERDAA